MTELTQARLRELLDYCPETGVFRWKGGRSRVSAGLIAGHLDNCGYIRITVDGRRHMAHRAAWLWVNGECPETMQVDHRDGDKTNNRIGNLRLATRVQNLRNARMRKGKFVPFKGVSYRETVRYRDGRVVLRASPYVAQIRHGGKQRTIGYFKTAEEAHRAYCAEAEKHFGDFARAS